MKPDIQHFFRAYGWVLVVVGLLISTVAATHLWISQDQLQAKAWSFPGSSWWHQLRAGDQADSGSVAPDEPVPSPAVHQYGQVKGISTVIETADARPLIVANFLRRYNSPLQPYDHFGQVFVDLADKNGFDFRLLPAIAMQESNLCKRIPPGSYNCLGFGIHERGTLMFDSYEANFERAARELKANYINQGLTTPAQIMTKYTPHSNGSWANSVNQWMAEMKYDDSALGREHKVDGSVLEYALDS